MKFVGRELELAALKALEEHSKHVGIMTVLTGRRRIGKTSLALHHCTRKSFLPFCSNFLKPSTSR